MGQIIKFQHELFNGTLDGQGKPDIDILYPKTSADMVEGLSTLIQSLLTDTLITSITIVSGTSEMGAKIRITLSDGSILESGGINVASKTTYGVIKLSNTISSSESVAATPLAVKTAYDLANSANETAEYSILESNTNKSNIESLVSILNNQLLRVAVFHDISVKVGTPSTIDMTAYGITADNIVNVIAFYVNESMMNIINEGVSFAIIDNILHITSNAKDVISIKVVYNYAFSLASKDD